MKITPRDKILSRQKARELGEKLRKEGKVIVFTNGCFDILHRGHIEYLEYAKSQGDVLVVGINDDDSVRRLKGKNRPVNKLQDRMYVLAALYMVDFIIPFSQDTPYELIKEVKPHILVKGGDYEPHDVVGKDIVESYGGKIIIAPYKEGYSTSHLLNKIKKEEKSL